jgi:hypothetical protein
MKILDSRDRQVALVGCTVQVFKLRGADRKHKQDRDKLAKKLRQADFCTRTC